MNIPQLVKRISRYLAIFLFSLLEITGLPKVSRPADRQRAYDRD